MPLCRRRRRALVLPLGAHPHAGLMPHTQPQVTRRHAMRNEVRVFRIQNIQYMCVRACNV
jgi:hypothetical protein